MRNKAVIALIMCVVMCSMGCGKRNPEKVIVDEKITNEQNSEKEQIQDETMQDKANVLEGDILAGVYMNGGKLTDVKLGFCIDGEKKEFCSIKMPTKYIFGGIFHDIEGNNLETSNTAEDSVLRYMDGSNSLEDILEKGSLDGIEYPVSYALLTSFEEDKSKVNFYLGTSDELSLESEKEYAPDGKELGTEEHPAYYYRFEDEYITEDLDVVYQINDDILLRMTYEGPLVDTIGIDKLAQNMYDLVTVLE